MIYFVHIGLLKGQSCDFENGLCGWTQYKKDKFDWTRATGTTSSSGTGPSSDHTSKVKTLNSRFHSFKHRYDKIRVKKFKFI